MPPATDTRLLSKVATLYYSQDLSQQEIATRLGLSRPKVSRLLQRARDLGIVQIIVHTRERDHSELEAALEGSFGLREAIVVGPPETEPPAVARHLGAVAAGYLARTLSDTDVVGLSWGRTVHALVSSVRPRTLPDARVVQLIGGIGAPEADAHASDVSRRLAQSLGCQLTLLPAPWLVSSPEVHAALLSDPYVNTAYGYFDQISLAFVGIGSIAGNPALDVEPGLVSELRAAGAVGDVAMRFFDLEGRPVHDPIAGRVLGVSSDELRAAGRVVGVGGGPGKRDAVLGALRSGMLDVLITDSATAASVAAA